MAVNASRDIPVSDSSLSAGVDITGTEWAKGSGRRIQAGGRKSGGGRAKDSGRGQRALGRKFGADISGVRDER